MFIEGNIIYVGKKDVDAIEDGSHPLYWFLKPYWEQAKEKAKKHSERFNCELPIWVGDGLFAQLKDFENETHKVRRLSNKDRR